MKKFLTICLLCVITCGCNDPNGPFAYSTTDYITDMSQYCTDAGGQQIQKIAISGKQTYFIFACQKLPSPPTQTNTPRVVE